MVLIRRMKLLSAMCEGIREIVAYGVRILGFITRSTDQKNRNPSNN